MEFVLDPHLVALQEEATDVALKAAAESEFPEDSWIVGHDAGLRRRSWPAEAGSA